MKADISLPVSLPAGAGQRWACHTCGECCRRLVGHLFPHEQQAITDQNWAAELGIEPCVRVGRGWVLNKREDGACVFLGPDNLCRIHAKYGEAAKPLACRVFPFSVRPTDDGWQASLRFDCPSVTASLGKPVIEYARPLAAMAAELAATRPGRVKPDQLQTGLEALPGEISALCNQMGRWIDRSDLPFTNRIVVAARVTAALDSAKLRNVREARFAELVQLLVRGLAAEYQTLPGSPTDRQRGMLRQFVFACAEHVSLADLRAGAFARIRTRTRQLRLASEFRRGQGKVPPLPGLAADATFAEVDRVAPASVEAARVEELLVRYIQARLQGRSAFGAGFYGWPVFRGLGALWLSIAAVGWLARLRAATAGRNRLCFDDVARAVGTVDAAATRVPALGSLAERGRVLYLFSGEGLPRLAGTYAAVAEAS